jgi:hypothetical protein
MSQSASRTRKNIKTTADADTVADLVEVALNSLPGAASKRSTLISELTSSISKDRAIESHFRMVLKSGVGKNPADLARSLEDAAKKHGFPLRVSKEEQNKLAQAKTGSQPRSKSQPRAPAKGPTFIHNLKDLWSGEGVEVVQIEACDAHVEATGVILGTLNEFITCKDIHAKGHLAFIIDGIDVQDLSSKDKKIVEGRYNPKSIRILTKKSMEPDAKLFIRDSCTILQLGVKPIVYKPPIAKINFSQPVDKTDDPTHEIIISVVQGAVEEDVFKLFVGRDKDAVRTIAEELLGDILVPKSLCHIRVIPAKEKTSSQQAKPIICQAFCRVKKDKQDEALSKSGGSGPSSGIAIYDHRDRTPIVSLRACKSYAEAVQKVHNALGTTHLGVIQCGDHFAVRVRVDQQPKAIKLLDPNNVTFRIGAPFVIASKWFITNLPSGTSARTLCARLLEALKWQVEVLKELPGARSKSFVVGAACSPPEFEIPTEDPKRTVYITKDRSGGSTRKQIKDTQIFAKIIQTLDTSSNNRPPSARPRVPVFQDPAQVTQEGASRCNSPNADPKKRRWEQAGDEADEDMTLDEFNDEPCNDGFFTALTEMRDQKEHDAAVRQAANKSVTPATSVPSSNASSSSVPDWLKSLSGLREYVDASNGANLIKQQEMQDSITQVQGSIATIATTVETALKERDSKINLLTSTMTEIKTMMLTISGVATGPSAPADSVPPPAAPLF